MKLILGFILVFCAWTAPCFAQTYEVLVQQKPHGEVRAMTCTPENKPCFLTLHEKGGDIDIAANFAKDGAIFEFMRDHTYMATNVNGDTEALIPLKDGKGFQSIKLLERAPILRDHELLVLRHLPVIATLDIMIRTD